MPLTAIYTSRGSPCFGLDGKSQGLRRRVSNVTTKRLHSRPWTRTQLSHICRASNSDEDSSPLTVESIQKENEELLPRSKLPQQRRAEANGLLFSSIVQHPWEAMDQESMINLVALAFMFSLVFFEIMTIDVGVSRGWTPSEFITRTAIDSWGNYEMFLHQNPILVKAYTSGIVYAISDWLTQVIKKGKPLKFDRGSILRNASIGFFAHGPLTHFWYIFSDAILPYDPSWYGWIPKMALNQTVWAFTWNVLYIMLLETTQGKSAKQALRIVDKMWWPLQLEGWKFWPLVHVITYNFIPIDERVLWVDLVGVIWMMIVLSVLQKDESKGKEA